MFTKFILSVALSFVSIIACAQEVPASAASAAEASVAMTPETPTPAAVPAATSKTSSGGFGRWLGSTARSLVDSSQGFIDGVKKGFNKDQPETAPSQVAAAAQATSAATDSKKEVSVPRQKELMSMLINLAVGRQAPAPVETREVAPAAAVVSTESQHPPQ